MSEVTYLSQEGYDALKQELHELKSKGRKEIAAAIQEAREKGDLSENAEYDAAKEAQGMMEKKIAELEAIYAVAKVIDTTNLDNSQVYLLSKVTVLNKKVNKKVTYQVVSPKEADFKLGKISSESPIGKALMGTKIGETVKASVPAGTIEFEILDINR